VSLKMRLQGVIQRFGDTLEGHDRVNSEMNSKIVFKRVRRCTWRPRDGVNSEMHLEAVIERVW